MNIEIVIRRNCASTEIMKDGFVLDQNGITNWLFQKGVIEKDERVSQYCDVAPWARTGGETYGAVLEFSTEKVSKRIFLKALATMSPQKTLKDWERRRMILCEHEIPVSKWYSYTNGLIIEDYYPKEGNDTEFKKLLTIAFKLDNLGFSTLKFIDDMRCDERGQPYFIDFGFDLGEPSTSATTNAMNYLLKVFPQNFQEIYAYYDNLV